MLVGRPRHLAREQDHGHIHAVHSMCDSEPNADSKGRYAICRIDVAARRTHARIRDVFDAAVAVERNDLD